MEDVAKFVGLHQTGHQALPPEQLIKKWVAVLGAARRYVSQLSDEQLQERVIPNRNRTIRKACHHIFRIGEAFLETADEGVEFSDGLPSIDPPAGAFTTGAELAAYGDSVIARLELWWEGLADRSCQQQVETYFGSQPLAVLYERCTWHSAQHVRQLIAILERYNITPNGRLASEDFAGLPLPGRLWE